MLSHESRQKELLNKTIWDCNNRFYTDTATISELLNSYFINTENKLADQLPLNNADPTSYIKQSFLNSFIFRAMYSHDVHD